MQTHTSYLLTYSPEYLPTKLVTDSLTHAISYITTYMQDLSLTFQHTYILLHIIMLYDYKYHIL